MQRAVTFLLLVFASMPAWAGRIYINDVRADALRNTTLKAVDVFIDEEGHLYITAPNYNIQVVGEVEAEPDPLDPTSVDLGVDPGLWWLVTQDQSSSGHVIDVYVGGAKVRTLRSGEPGAMIDLGEYLMHGKNDVSFTARSDGEVGGGVFQVYVGRASNKGGTLHMDTPQIDFTRRSTDVTEIVQSFVLQVD